MRRTLLTFALAALVVQSVAACDVFYVARASVPLPAPVDTGCLHAELGTGTRYRPVQSEEIAHGRSTVVAYSTSPMFHNEWQTLTQVAWRDSSL